MAKKGRKNRIQNLRDLDFNPGFEVSHETKRWIMVVLLFVLGTLSLLSLINAAGTLGVYVNSGLQIGFGVTRWAVPVLVFLIGYSLFRPVQYGFRLLNGVGLILFLLGFNGLIHATFYQHDLVEAARSGIGGGYVGLILSWPFFKFMGFWASVVVLLGCAVVGFILLFETYIINLLERRAETTENEDRAAAEQSTTGLGAIVAGLRQRLDDRRVARAQARQSQLDSASYKDEYQVEVSDDDVVAPEFSQRGVEVETHGGVGDDMSAVNEATAGDALTTSGDASEDEQALTVSTTKFKKIKVDLPLALFDGKTTAPNGGDLKANKIIIQKTLNNFGIDAEMGEARVGPTVTQYTLKPADGVRLSKITGLSDNFALALAAHPIRIEAPIPGRSLVGIEVPNEAKASVPLGSMLASEEFKNRESNIMVALGKDVMGKSWFYALDRMPHLLIAGATGSGKSVSINTLILSLIFQSGPGEVKFIMVDPKRVELPLYNGIPHLLTPVITDIKKTINALRWAIREMEKRFDILSQAGNRNIATYNEENPDEAMPYIVFVIDELADIMAASGPEVEGAIVRLAQMSRAVGIHLVLATQRPSVDVITGLIKANIPARVAFSVASLVDSRTILDMSGAEKLLGKGDMLFMSADIPKPKRLQGAFASDKEIKRVIDHLKKQADPDYIEAVIEKHSPIGLEGGNDFSSDDDGGDPLLQEALQMVVRDRKASASLLQRRLRVGYSRAARILDLLEAKGVIGPADGAKPRDVLIGSAADATMDHTLIARREPVVPDGDYADAAEITEISEIDEAAAIADTDTVANDEDDEAYTTPSRTV